MNADFTKTTSRTSNLSFSKRLKSIKSQTLNHH